MAEAKSPGWARLRCETTCTIEFLHEITRELENSPWCCSWEILPDLDEHGGKVTEEIPEMDTESTPPSPPDRPTPPSPPDRPAKNEERADLELKAFRLQVEARKQTRKQARILVEQFFAEQSMLLLVPRRQLRGRLGGWPGRKTREEGGREGD